jgi:GTP1/Obg family GTP-binding protein
MSVIKELRLLDQLNEAYRDIKRISNERDELKSQLREWKDCTKMFFNCAGKSQNESWEQFEKAATKYQQLKTK